MDTDDIDDLKSVVPGLDRDTLATALLELATDDELVRRRLQRLRLAAQPRTLAAAFGGTLPQHDLEPHAALEVALRDQHPRKTAFWSRVTAG
jgi:hypothetical protein